MLTKIIRVKLHLEGLIADLQDRQESEDGFATAETIALAVAGVVVVGLALAYFRTNISGWLDNITGDITNF